MTDNLGDLLSAACIKFGGTPAIEEAGIRLSYDGLLASATALDSALREQGLVEDEPVLVHVSNEARDLAAFLGTWRAGGVVVPIHRTIPATVLEAISASTGARFLAINAKEDLLRKIGPVPPPHRPMLTNAAIIVFTSGSTGRPKGVILSHKAFVGKLEAIDSMLRFSPDTRALLVLQITFVFGVWVSLLTLMKGGVVLPHPRFEPMAVFAALAEQRVTDAAFVPTMLRKFLGLDSTIARPLAARTCLKRILTGGEPLGRELGRQIRELFPQASIADIYGSTETCSSDFFLMPEELETFPGTIGHPSPDVGFRIADVHGQELSLGEVGELQIRTRFAMSGYLDEPELTRAAFCGDFFRTGDLARLRPDGVVELAGRAKDLIMRGGTKVSPFELDHLLGQHPAVAEALTVGVPDAVLGECIHALIVPRDGQKVDEAELRQWVAERVEWFKRPDVYHFGQALPTGRTGKVDRAALRQKIRESRGF